MCLQEQWTCLQTVALGQLYQTMDGSAASSKPCLSSFAFPTRFWSDHNMADIDWWNVWWSESDSRIQMCVISLIWLHLMSLLISDWMCVQVCAHVCACIRVYVCVGGRKRELVAKVGEWVGERVGHRLACSRSNVENIYINAEHKYQ